MVKLSQIEYKKPFKKPLVFRRAWGLKRTQWGDFKGVSPLRQGSKGRSHILEFVRLQGARK